MTEQKIDMEKWRKRPLYKLLYSRLTWLRSKTQTELLDVHKFARSIDYSHEAIYKWLRSGKLSPKGAKAIVKKARGKIALTDLYPFVLS